MPVCEKCQTPYDEWQHFCLQCGKYLRSEPPPSCRCPQCGIQAALEQNFCHGCAAPLKEDMAYPAAPPYHRKWLAAGIVAAILGLGVIFVSYLILKPWTNPHKMFESPVQSFKAAGNPAVSGDADANGPITTVSSLRADFEGVFNQIKEANLTKNILLYMDTLSAVYPRLDKKREEVFKTWEKFDFKEMAFTVNKIQEVGNGNALVEVNWSTSTQNLATKDRRSDDFQYRVWFAKELGHWKIKKIEELQP
jgi:hypothetical protein